MRWGRQPGKGTSPNQLPLWAPGARAQGKMEPVDNGAQDHWVRAAPVSKVSSGRQNPGAKKCRSWQLDTELLCAAMGRTRCLGRALVAPTTAIVPR